MRGSEWFRLFDTSKPLEQGVILDGFEYLDVGSVNGESLRGENTLSKVTNDVIILTQSCDLVNTKTRNIHLCPIRKLSEVFDELEITSNSRKSGLFGEFKRGHYIDKFLTNICKSKAFNRRFYGEYYVVMFDQAVVVANSYVREFATQRRRRLMLSAPYREAMAQAYGRYFMRVGTPTDILPIDLSSYPITI